MPITWCTRIGTFFRIQGTTMTVLLFTLALIVVFVVLGNLLFLKPSRTRGDRASASNYRARSHFLSPAERSFYGVLKQAVGDRVAVFAMVRVGDVLTPAQKRSANRSRWQSEFNRVSAKHFDFVLCSPDGGRVLLAIELDDRSHQQKVRQARDGFLDAAMASAGLPLVRVPAKRGYSILQLLELLGPHLGLDSAEQEKAPIGAAGGPAEGSCGQCGAPVVLRRGRKGAMAGQQFLGCSTYPACRWVQPMSPTPEPSPASIEVQ
ncbi:MAG: hypothetical protein CMN28_14670 [Salinisphaeraceae bacterium]|nr:hypothetical protein [Salinisphaeraceae bacterium]